MHTYIFLIYVICIKLRPHCIYAMIFASFHPAGRNGFLPVFLVPLPVSPRWVPPLWVSLFATREPGEHCRCRHGRPGRPKNPRATRAHTKQPLPTRRRSARLSAGTSARRRSVSLALSLLLSPVFTPPSGM